MRFLWLIAFPLLAWPAVRFTEHTIASDYEEGSDVNLEVDLLARYLERLAQSRGLLAPLAPERP